MKQDISPVALVVLIVVFALVGWLNYKYRLGWRTQLYDIRTQVEGRR